MDVLFLLFWFHHKCANMTETRVNRIWWIVVTTFPVLWYVNIWKFILLFFNVSAYNIPVRNYVDDAYPRLFSRVTKVLSSLSLSVKDKNQMPWAPLHYIWLSAKPIKSPATLLTLSCPDQYVQCRFFDTSVSKFTEGLFCPYTTYCSSHNFFNSSKTNLPITDLWHVSFRLVQTVELWHTAFYVFWKHANISYIAIELARLSWLYNFTLLYSFNIECIGKFIRKIGVAGYRWWLRCKLPFKLLHSALGTFHIRMKGPSRCRIQTCGLRSFSELLELHTQFDLRFYFWVLIF